LSSENDPSLEESIIDRYGKKIQNSPHFNAGFVDATTTNSTENVSTNKKSVSTIKCRVNKSS
jgi:hypothetical protein